MPTCRRHNVQYGEYGDCPACIEDPAVQAEIHRKHGKFGVYTPNVRHFTTAIAHDGSAAAMVWMEEFWSAVCEFADNYATENPPSVDVAIQIEKPHEPYR